MTPPGLCHADIYGLSTWPWVQQYCCAPGPKCPAADPLSRVWHHNPSGGTVGEPWGWGATLTLAALGMERKREFGGLGPQDDQRRPFGSQAPFALPPPERWLQE